MKTKQYTGYVLALLLFVLAVQVEGQAQTKKKVLNPDPGEIPYPIEGFPAREDLSDYLVSTNIDSTYLVASLSGRFSVNPSGETNYTLPIELPHGSGHLMPKLSVLYGNNRSSSLFNLGFGLGGFSIITREPNNRIVDDNDFPITYSQDDVFSLDGTRLVKTATGTYMKVNAPSQEIYKTTDGFTYQEINGNVYAYNHKVYAPVPEFNQEYLPAGHSSNELVSAYCMSKITDPNGNTIDFEYVEDDFGSSLPKRITYGGAFNNHVNSIVFHYIASDQVAGRWINGFYRTSGHLLNEISIESAGSLLYKYKFEYGYSRMYGAQLRSVSRETSDGEEYCPVYFSWMNTLDILKETQSVDVELTEEDVGGSVVCDFNGDGKQDLFAKSRIYYAGENGHFVVGNRVNDTIYANKFDVHRQEQSIGYEPEITLSQADLNGDGSPDLLMLHRQIYNYPLVYEMSKTTSCLSVFYSSENGVTMEPESFLFDSENGNYKLTKGCRIPNSDVEKRGPTNIGLDAGVGVVAPEDLSFKLKSPVVRVEDINGDGMAEVIVLSPSYSSKRISDGGGNNTDKYTYLGTDVIVYQLKDGELEQITSISTQLEDDSNSMSSSEFDLRLLDVNHDDIPDIVLSDGSVYSFDKDLNTITLVKATSKAFSFDNSKNYLGDTNIKTVLKGTQLQALAPDMSRIINIGSPLAVEKVLASLDLNGDGKTEVIAIGRPVYGVADGRATDDRNLSGHNQAQSGLPEEVPAVYTYFGNPVLVYSYNNSWEVCDTLCLVDDLTFLTLDKYTSPRFAVSTTGVDINNDGRDDLVLTIDEFSPFECIGQPITLNHLRTKTLLFPGCLHLKNCKDNLVEVEGTNFVIDYDGDGCKELFDYENNIMTDWAIDKRNSYLKGVIDGFNKETLISYTSIADSVVYSSSETAYPDSVFVRLFPRVVTSAVRQSNGSHGYNELSYKYTDMLVDKRDRIPIGFNSFTIHNYEMNAEQTTIFRYFGSRVGVVPELVNKKVNHNLIHSTKYAYVLVPLEAQRHYLKIASVIDQDYLQNTTHQKSFEQYDQWGNPGIVHTSSNDGVSITTASSFASDTKNRSLPNQISETRNYNGKSVVTQIDCAYENDNLTQKTVTLGGRTSTVFMEYDNFGNLIEQKASNGTLLNAYDPSGRFVTSQTFPGNQTVHFEYDLLGNRISEEDPNNLETKMQYDPSGALIRTVFPDGNSVEREISWSADTAYVYEIKTIKSGGYEETGFYDLFGKQLKNVSPGLNGDVVSERVYNTLGQLAETTKPYYGNEPSEVALYTYDQYGRITSLKGAGKDLTYSYNGNAQSVADRYLGLTVQQEFNADGLVVKSTDLAKISYQYTPAGQLSEVNVLGTSLKFEYDGAGNQTKMIDPDAGIWDTEYNDQDQVIAENSPIGSASATYDDQGRIKTRNNGEFQVGYSYDRQFIGYLDELNGNNMSFANTYDQFGRKTRYNKIVGGDSYQYEMAYDAVGRIATYVFPNGYALNYSYTAEGILNGISDSKGPIGQLKKATALGKVKRLMLGNGSETVYEYDNLGRLIAKTSGQCEQSYRYDKNKFLQMTGRTHRFEGGRYVSNDQFEYDNFNRLTASSGVNDEDYHYSDAGNMTYRGLVGAFSYSGSRPHAISGLTPSAGAFLKIPENQQSITYTAFGKVSLISEGDYDMEFVYGPDESLCIETLKYKNQIVRRRFRIDSDYEVIEEKDKPVRTICYIRGFGGIIAARVKEEGQNARIFYIHQDHLGSIIQLTDANGNVVENRSYDAWGRPQDIVTGNSLVNPGWIISIGYTGHEHLPEFNLINMQGRLYDPIVGRFLSPDPLIQDPGYSQNYNRYSYCLNNPLAYTDPTGYAYFAEGGDEWWLKFLRNDDYLLPGENGNGTGLNGVYYDWYSGTYRSVGFGNPEVGWGYAYSAAIEPYSTNVPVHGSRFGSRNGVFGVWHQQTSVSGQHRVGAVGSADFQATFSADVTSVFVPVGASSQGGGPGWEAFVGAAGTAASEMYYSEKYGTWMGKNFKMYKQTWGGNGFTGGKNKFGKTTSNAIKWGGRALGAWNAYSIQRDYAAGEMGTGWMLAEQGTNAFSTLGGIYGAAWGVGWELGRGVTNMGWYQEAKFNFWYNRWENQVGAPSQSNEALWYYFYQNYKP